MDRGSKVCIQGSDLASWVQESQLYKELRISAKESWAEQTRQRKMQLGGAEKGLCDGFTKVEEQHSRKEQCK